MSKDYGRLKTLLDDGYFIPLFLPCLPPCFARKIEDSYNIGGIIIKESNFTQRCEAIGAEYITPILQS